MVGIVTVVTTPVTTATIPYIKGTSETISQILQSYNIRVAHKTTTTFSETEHKTQDWLNTNEVREMVMPAEQMSTTGTLQMTSTKRKQNWQTKF